MNTTDESEYMTAAEVAEMLRTTKAGLYNMRFRREGPPAIRLGKRGLLFRRADVEQWLTERAEQPEQQAS